jgi:hypothetical protein
VEYCDGLNLADIDAEESASESESESEPVTETLTNEKVTIEPEDTLPSVEELLDD